MHATIAQVISREVLRTRARNPGRPVLIGLGGAQGSGKSTICRTYAEANPRVAHFSLDDVYLTKFEREARAANILRRLNLTNERDVAALTPLFTTRGPPGTHDLTLADNLIAWLARPKRTPLPRFDKRIDDRSPRAAWPSFLGPAKAILVEGWCLGAMASLVAPPMNAVEHEDAAPSPGGDMTPWRDSIYEALSGPYDEFFERFDAIIYLQAPSWEIVRVWRGQQEEETLGRPLTHEENAALDRFMMHYERITREQMEGWNRAQIVVQLDEARNVIGIEGEH